MPYRINFFEKGWPVHIFSRTVDNKEIFEDKDNCYRFIFQMYAVNIGRPAFNIKRLDVIKAAKAILEGEKIPAKFIIKQHPPLVNFLDFVFVITHYHFCLLPTSKNSIPLYMKILNGSFARYFNLKHERKGALFSSRYNSILIKTDFQLSAITRYINIINPLDIYSPGWRKKGLKNWKEALNFLENYEFSSFPDKIRKRKSKILAPDKILNQFYGENFKDRGDYFNLNFVKDFLKQKLFNCASPDEAQAQNDDYEKK